MIFSIAAGRTRLAWFGLAVALPLAAQTLPNGLSFPIDLGVPRSATQVVQVPSYLTNPPSVLTIGPGRQLFVDDFLIESTTLSRTIHKPVIHPGSPILRPGGADAVHAIPFSDGVWFDPADGIYKMFYWGGNGAALCYATSLDGKVWIKPSIPDAVFADTNIVLLAGGGRDSGTVWMDLADSNPARKFKAFIYTGGNRLSVYFSPDGIHWTTQPFQIQSVSDRTTMFWNPMRNRWVESIRSADTLPPGLTRPSHVARLRFYSESTDLQTWNPVQGSLFWIGADEDEPPYPGNYDLHYPQLYNLDVVAYESLFVGMFSLFYPEPGPNLVELGVGFSRDGFQWHRPQRGGGPNAFIAAANAPDVWNGYNTQSVGGAFLVAGDELWFYFTGRNAKHGIQPTAMSTGLAILRRDGFASMQAGSSEGTLTTRPLRFTGSRLFVNVNNPGGQLRVEVLDQSGNPIPTFSKANAVPISADKTLQMVSWNGYADVSSLAGQTVRLRFSMTQGALYSFWFSPSVSGASHGYVAAGGPGLPGAVDTAGLGGGASTPGDTTPPVRTAAALVTGYSRQAAARLTTNEAALCSFAASAGTPFASMTRMASTGSLAHAHVFTGLPAGTHTYHVRCRDTNGNVNGDDATVSVVSESSGETPLEILNLTVTDIFPVQATIRWSTPAQASAQVFFGATPALGSASPLLPSSGPSHAVTLSNLAPATTYHIRAESTVNGTTASKTTSFTTPAAPTTPLTFTGIATTFTARDAVVIAWSTNRPSSTQVLYGTTAALGSSSPTNPALTTEHSVALSGLQLGVTYQVSLVGVEAGGISTSHAAPSFTTSETLAISNANASSVSPNSATITWSTNLPTTDLLSWGTTPSYRNGAIALNAPSSTHSVPLTGLTADTAYYVRIVSTDQFGGTAVVDGLTFRSARTPVAISEFAVYAITNTQAFVSWRTSRETRATVDYGPTEEYGSTINLTVPRVSTYTVLTGLQQGTTYYLKLTVTDANGATGSVMTSFTTTGTPAAPILSISGVQSGSITPGSAAINWSTNLAATRLVQYGTTTSLGQATVLQSDLSTLHAVPLSGLNPGVTYYFRAVSVDAGGRAANSAVLSFTTTAAEPPPLQISNVQTGSIAANSVQLTWTTNLAANRKVNYGTTARLGSATPTSADQDTSHSVTVNGLAAGTTYYLQAVSTDSGGRTATSAISSFATAAAEPPPLQILNPQTGNITANSVQLTWTTNLAANRKVSYGSTPALGTTTPTSPDHGTSHAVTVNGLTAGATYYVQAVSTDSQNRSAFSPVLSFTASGAASPPPTPPSSHTLIVTPSTAAPGSIVTVQWTAPPGAGASDWLGLYELNGHNREYRWYTFTRGATSGMVNMMIRPDASGQYEVRYLVNNSYTSVARSNPITVGTAP